MYSWDNYFLHSLRGCKVFIGPEPGPAKHEAPLQSRSSTTDHRLLSSFLLLLLLLSSSVYDTHLRTILMNTDRTNRIDDARIYGAKEMWQRKGILSVCFHSLNFYSYSLEIIYNFFFIMEINSARFVIKIDSI